MRHSATSAEPNYHVLKAMIDGESDSDLRRVLTLHAQSSLFDEVRNLGRLHVKVCCFDAEDGQDSVVRWITKQASNRLH